ncbi:MAG: diaminopimelate epimerase [Bifidobacterium sp.]|uniref:diaminopimelate epimerase n=1 Tax=Bifidobacterium sp. TaxID=41200 RepID=UPI0039ED1C62
MSVPDIVYKGHGTGNDFVIYADPDGRYEPTAKEVRRVTDRHFGIGGDGLIRLAHPQDVTDLSPEMVRTMQRNGVKWFMDYRNADGSLAQMCGNGTRVSALFAQMVFLESTAVASQDFILGTRAGVKSIREVADDPILGKSLFQVDMGPWKVGVHDRYAVTLPGAEGLGRGTFADLGNPHIVVVTQNRTSSPALLEQAKLSSLGDLADLDLTKTPMVEPILEDGQNVEFLDVVMIDEASDHGMANMRVNERGVGETLSCGTGLCASAAVLRSLTGIDHWTLGVPGGKLRVDVETDRVLLTGAARIVARIKLGDGALQI